MQLEVLSKSVSTIINDTRAGLRLAIVELLSIRQSTRACIRGAIDEARSAGLAIIEEIRQCAASGEQGTTEVTEAPATEVTEAPTPGVSSEPSTVIAD